MDLSWLRDLIIMEQLKLNLFIQWHWLESEDFIDIILIKIDDRMIFLRSAEGGLFLCMIHETTHDPQSALQWLEIMRIKDLWS